MRRSPATVPGRRRTLFRTGCPRTLPGSGRRSGSGRPGRMCALCSAAFRKERRRLREIPPRRRLFRTGCPRTCRGAGEGPAAVVRDECAPCAARHSERSGADCGKSLRGGGLSARDVPGTCRGAGERPAAADAGGCEKTAGSRKIDENLIFGTRAFVFYPLSLAAPKILRLNKIANKFAFVSGLFVSLRLKPKYANRP